MKKMIIVLALFILMMTAAIGEIVFTSNFFKDVHAELVKVEESMDAHQDALDNPETVTMMENALTKWNKGKKVALVLGNHNVIRSADEKLVSLARLIGLNAYNDAAVMMAAAKNYIYDLIKDNYPLVSNLF